MPRERALSALEAAGSLKARIVDAVVAGGGSTDFIEVDLLLDPLDTLGPVRKVRPKGEPQVIGDARLATVLGPVGHFHFVCHAKFSVGCVATPTRAQTRRSSQRPVGHAPSAKTGSGRGGPMNNDLTLELLAGWPVVVLVLLVFGSCAVSPWLLQRMGGSRFFRRRRG